MTPAPMKAKVEAAMISFILSNFLTFFFLFEYTSIPPNVVVESFQCIEKVAVVNISPKYVCPEVNISSNESLVHTP